MPDLGPESPTPEPIEPIEQKSNPTLSSEDRGSGSDSVEQKIPPIEGTFSPDKEVQRLWSVPKEQRAEAISIFKDKMTQQRKAWALCRTSIEEHIESNPDLPSEELVAIIREYASHYGFAKPHIKAAEQSVDNYIGARKRALKIREEYPDNIALINRLTGMRFTDADGQNFSVKVGSMTIDIICPGPIAGRIFTSTKDPVEGFGYKGFARKSNDCPPIYYVVISNSAESEIEESELHEHEHIKSWLLHPKSHTPRKVQAHVKRKLDRGISGLGRQVIEKVLHFERNFYTELDRKYRSSNDPQEKAFFLEEYMKLKRESALDEAKDEIVSYLRDGSLFTPRQLHHFFFSQNRGAYDYLGAHRDWSQNDPLYQKTAQKVYVVEYKAIIENAVNHFYQLIDHGYTKELAIALLSDKSLPDWPKTIRRQLEAEQTQGQEH